MSRARSRACLRSADANDVVDHAGLEGTDDIGELVLESFLRWTGTYTPELDEVADARDEGRSRLSRSMSMLAMGCEPEVVGVLSMESNEE